MTAWTEERIARLEALWRAGRSAACVARILGPPITRSAVLGKVHRLGLSATRPGAAHPPAALASPKRAPRAPIRPGAAAVAVQTHSILAAPSHHAGGLRTILTVGRGECRWPMGDPRDRSFSLCGRPSARGAFCAGHAAIAYRAAPPDAESLLLWFDREVARRQSTDLGAGLTGRRSPLRV